MLCNVSTLNFKKLQNQGAVQKETAESLQKVGFIGLRLTVKKFYEHGWLIFLQQKHYFALVATCLKLAIRILPQKMDIKIGGN